MQAAFLRVHSSQRLISPIHFAVCGTLGHSLVTSRSYWYTGRVRQREGKSSSPENRRREVERLIPVVRASLIDGKTTQKEVLELMFAAVKVRRYVEFSWDVLKRAQELGPVEIKCYHYCLNALSQYGHAVKAEELVAAMRKAGHPIELKAYTMMAEAYYRSHQIDGARAVLHAMEQSGVAPDERMLRLFVRMAGKWKEPDEVKSTYARIVKLVGTPSVETHRAAMKAYKRCGDLDSMVVLAKQIVVGTFEPRWQ